jgi:His/Glu/Gln/Arg/opine family amino acid ABC transporter permease subunit
MMQILPDFIPRFLTGVVLNFEIAAGALLLGLLIGAPLALARLRGRSLGVLASGATSILRAAPTFVVMFFILYAVPRQFSVFDIPVSISGTLVVVLALTVYSAAYTADHALEALRHLRLGERHAALLFLPNMARAFFVLVLSSGTGAAIGVSEAVSTTLRQAERLPNLADRLLLFLLVMLFFTATLQAAFAAVSLVRKALGSSWGAVSEEAQISA